MPARRRTALIAKIFHDQGSASHPAAPVGAAPILDAVGILHPRPMLVVMPDDPRLGEFRKDFAGMLGTIEEYPTVPKDVRGFAGAAEIIDSDELLKKINEDPQNQVDARAFLRARLVDILLGDNDRHPGQWKWARLRKGSDAPWEPITRDRDKVFVSYEGLLLNAARFAAPSLVTFRDVYPDATALFQNATDFDRRLLGSLDRTTWDAVVAGPVRTIDDAVIDKAVGAMPAEYAASSGRIAQILHARRDKLPEAAGLYYRQLWSVADIHGTDSAEKATVVRSADGAVDVSMQSGGKSPYFHRRFDPRETSEIRVYLHDGNDSAIVTGNVPRTIKVRIIGGNGDNSFVDMSTVGGEKNPTRLYDAGSTQKVKYARDTVDEGKDEATALNHYFNRRPWVHAFGTSMPPMKDHGSSIEPLAGIKTGHGLGLVPRVGVARYAYGFRRVPYSNMVKADAAWSTATHGFQVRTDADKRFESSDVHLAGAAGMSQLDVIQFRGFGNDVPYIESRFYDVRQTQWQFRPAVGLSFAPESDISLGPVIRYATTDSTRQRFISDERPYGFTRFGQVGAQLKLHYDTREARATIRNRSVLDVAGSAYPAIWDVASAYQAIEAVAVSYLTLPVATSPVLALRAGGKKLFGDFPYFDAAFLGGGSSFRTEHRQRYAGDASVYGTTELRVPIAKFPLILPLDVGVLGFMDAGRVYVDGDSPGGWHRANGAGFWVGAINPGLNVNVLFTDRANRRTMVNLGFAF
ncbi:MAG: hypothetical protein Q7S20_05815 [Gemmatimonadaceae bacterium]|nr:hypothetical protein [Gemmatimonadaceae bacterium]